MRGLSLGAAALGLGALAFLWVQRQGPGMASLRLLTRLGLCPRALKGQEAELARLDARLISFYREHPGRCALALGCLSAAWALHQTGLFGGSNHFTSNPDYYWSHP